MMMESKQAFLNNESNTKLNSSIQAEISSSLARGMEGHTMTPLPDDFQPGDNDVICARGSRVFNYIGNCRFRLLVAAHLTEYNATTTKVEKSQVLAKVVSIVRLRCAVSGSHGGFVKKMPNNNNQWCEVGDFVAREKTSQAFRDILHEKYSSSNENKRRKRNSKSDLLSSLSAPILKTSQSATAFVPTTTTSKSSQQENPLIEALRNSKSRRYASTTAANSSGGLYAAEYNDVTSSWSQSCRNFEWNAAPAVAAQEYEEEPMQNDSFTSFLGHASFPAASRLPFTTTFNDGINMGGNNIYNNAFALNNKGVFPDPEKKKIANSSNNTLLMDYCSAKKKNNSIVNNINKSASATQQMFAKFMFKGNHPKCTTSTTTVTTTTIQEHLPEQQQQNEESITVMHQHEQQVEEEGSSSALLLLEPLPIDYLYNSVVPCAGATGDATNHDNNDDSLLLDQLHESLGCFAVDMSSDPFEPSPMCV